MRLAWSSLHEQRFAATVSGTAVGQIPCFFFSVLSTICPYHVILHTSCRGTRRVLQGLHLQAFHVRHPRQVTAQTAIPEHTKYESCSFELRPSRWKSEILYHWTGSAGVIIPVMRHGGLPSSNLCNRASELRTRFYSYMALKSTVAYHAEFLTPNRALDLQVDVYSDLEYNHDMERNRYLNPDLYRARKRASEHRATLSSLVGIKMPSSGPIVVEVVD